MYKDNYIFPAIINKNEDGDYVVKFPDFSHIITYGENMEEAYFMAEDALKLELFDLYSDKVKIPKATDITDIKHDIDETLIVIRINLKETIRQYDNKAVKKL